MWLLDVLSKMCLYQCILIICNHFLMMRFKYDSLMLIKQVTKNTELFGLMTGTTRF